MLVIDPITVAMGHPLLRLVSLDDDDDETARSGHSLPCASRHTSSVPLPPTAFRMDKPSLPVPHDPLPLSCITRTSSRISRPRPGLVEPREGVACLPLPPLEPCHFHVCARFVATTPIQRSSNKIGKPVSSRPLP
jgi:hypothetical protein